MIGDYALALCTAYGLKSWFPCAVSPGHFDLKGPARLPLCCRVLFAPIEDEL